jgi:hypothetical protein
MDKKYSINCNVTLRAISPCPSVKFLRVTPCKTTVNLRENFTVPLREILHVRVKSNCVAVLKQKHPPKTAGQGF